MKTPAAVAAVIALVLGAATLQAVVPTQQAEAAVASQFDPGMIISDALFFDGGAMSENAVQNFLNSQVRSCAGGYVCLKDYRQDTPSRAATAGRCAAYTGAANESAASIITRVGVACGISQAVMLVLLQKEQGIVTSTKPSAGAYRSATGYGCPDTAACDSTYYGFFNQVYAAASQFKRYALNPSSWNHIAGRVNAIRLHPNAACGSVNVLIQNQATAGLYNYTPYQPNGAALNNLYGTGDACSSYGNRNFWRIYTDWFGSTTISSLVRTPSNDSVYLISGRTKYSVDSAAYPAYSALGGVSFVSQSYLDTLTTGPAARRIIRAPDGGLYFIDAAIKTQFTSCDMVVDYGGSCDPSGYVQLTDAQVAAFHTGPYATQVLGTTAGARYLLDDGTKREVLDNAAQAAAGLAPGFNVLTEAGVAALPFGSPLVRDGIIVTQRGGADAAFLSGSKKYPIIASDAAAMGSASRSSGALWSQSLAQIPIDRTFPGAASAGGSSPVYILTAQGRYSVSDPTMIAALAPLTVPQALLDAHPDLGVLAPGTAVKASNSDLVYVLVGTTLRPAASWDALVAVSGSANPRIVAIAGSTVDALPKGAYLLAPGMMYRTASDPRIYLVDGFSEKVYVGSFDSTSAAGFTTWTYATQSILDGYTTDPVTFSYGIICGSTKYVAVAGALRPIPTGSEALFPFAYVTLDATTCATTRIGAPAIDFIRTNDGSIYQLVGGQKLHVGGGSLARVNAGRGWMSVPDSFANAIPSGTPIRP